jgi:hypothetical protein
MPAIITNKFRIHNSEQFVESFSETASNAYYLGIGAPLSWGTYTRADLRTDITGSDTSPIVPADSVTEELYTFDDLLAAKKISASNVSYVIPRRNWTVGTVYDMYRNDYGNRITGTTTTLTSTSGASNLFDSTFYVLNSAYNVYKCLDNNNGVASTVEPTGTSTSILSTGDGYKWKFMYTLSASQQINFLSTDFMAVQTNSTVQSAAVDGGVNIIKIKNGGTGGTNGTYAGVPLRGDGSGGFCTVVISGTAVTGVTVTSAGTGYTFASVRNADINTASSGFLTGAELDCIIEPKGGHGFNAVKEFGGFFVMMNINLEGTESANTGDFTTENDFRKIVLLKDPESLGSVATSSTLRTTKAIRIAASPTPGTFQVDEKISQATTGAVGRVVEWDAVNRILHYVQTRFVDGGINASGNLVAFSGANIITGATSGATGTPSASASDTADSITFSNGYAASELDVDKGDVIYIENRAPITRAADQTENIKLIIEF